MSHLLIPGPATADSAVMWAAVIDEPDDPKKLEIVVATGERQVLGKWDYDLDGGKRRVHIRRVEFTGLGERSRRLAELRRAGGPVARAMMGTLPKRVPSLEERPFTILLGSCFAQKKDGAGNVGRTFALLPSDARPDLKLLVGDQVPVLAVHAGRVGDDADAFAADPVPVVGGEPVQPGPYRQAGEQPGFRGGRRGARGQPGGYAGRARGEQAPPVHRTAQVSPCPYG